MLIKVLADLDLDLCKSPTYILNIFFFPYFTVMLKIYKDSFLLWPEVGDLLTLQRGTGPPMWNHLSHLTVMVFNVYLNNL